MDNSYIREQNIRMSKKTPQNTPLYSKYSGPELIKYAYEEFRNVYKNKVKYPLKLEERG